MAAPKNPEPTPVKDGDVLPSATTVPPARDKTGNKAGEPDPSQQTASLGPEGATAAPQRGAATLIYNTNAGGSRHASPDDLVSAIHAVGFTPPPLVITRTPRSRQGTSTSRIWARKSVAYPACGLR